MEFETLFTADQFQWQSVESILFLFVFIVAGFVMKKTPANGNRWLKFQASMREKPRSKRFMGWFIVGFSVLMLIGEALNSYIRHANYTNALATHEYLTVEGPIEEFHSGPKAESFTVDHQVFHYSDAVITGAYNHQLGYGGPLYMGRYLRIAYLKGSDLEGNLILRLEVQKLAAKAPAVKTP